MNEMFILLSKGLLLSMRTLVGYKLVLGHSQTQFYDLISSGSFLHKYVLIQLLFIFSKMKVSSIISRRILENLKYAIVFVLTNTSKYVYERTQHIFTEIRSYLLPI